ncbi:MAG: hypothetical protein Q7R81_04405 [Candidatus Peregrinibacteria bacterium]|nr:hypothetical protein [Candidatus Peregrinibacteria bacterium]
MTPRLKHLASIAFAFSLTACSSSGDFAVMSPIVQNGEFSAEVRTEPLSLTVGVPTTIFYRFRENGKVVNIEDRYLMVHAFLASEDLLDVYHTIEIVREEDNSHPITHTFLRAGRYRIFVELEDPSAEFRHGKHALLIASHDVVVEGQSIPVEPPVNPAINGARSTHLEANNLKTGTASLIVRAEEGGKPIAFFAGMPSIYVMVGPDLDLIGHGHTHGPADVESVDEITYQEVLPKAGNYALWTELYPSAEESFTPLQAFFHFMVE